MCLEAGSVLEGPNRSRLSSTDPLSRRLLEQWHADTRAEDEVAEN